MSNLSQLSVCFSDDLKSLSASIRVCFGWYYLFIYITNGDVLTKSDIVRVYAANLQLCSKLVFWPYQEWNRVVPKQAIFCSSSTRVLRLEENFQASKLWRGTIQSRLQPRLFLDQLCFDCWCVECVLFANQLFVVDCNSVCFLGNYGYQQAKWCGLGDPIWIFQDLATIYRSIMRCRATGLPSISNLDVDVASWCIYCLCLFSRSIHGKAHRNGFWRGNSLNWARNKNTPLYITIPSGYSFNRLAHSSIIILSHYFFFFFLFLHSISVLSIVSWRTASKWNILYHIYIYIEYIYQL